MVIKDDAFSSIVAAFRQGRAIFLNIRKSVLFMLCTNVVEILGGGFGGGRSPSPAAWGDLAQEGLLGLHREADGAVTVSFLTLGGLHRGPNFAMPQWARHWAL